jgi:hypothetical protein
MKRLSIRQYMAKMGFDMMSEIRKNVNGYLYISFIASSDPSNVVSIWFGKEASNNFTAGSDVDPDAVFVTEVSNAAGETRLKLTDKEGDAVATLEARGFKMVSGLKSASPKTKVLEVAGDVNSNIPF